MLSDRVYTILKHLSSQEEALCASETPFEINDLTDLVEEGLVRTVDKSISGAVGEFPRTSTAYKLTPKGEDAILLHERSLKKELRDEKIARSTHGWTITSAIIAIIALLVSLASWLLPIKFG